MDARVALASQVAGMPLGVQLIGYPQQDRALSGVATFLAGLDLTPAG